ncbi:MAG: type II toxin-antitoxin system PemK/MazF family toxin [Ignavibacteriota bacterium]
MTSGDIVLIPFPFAELTQLKARPAVVISETADKYHDLIVAAISSVIPSELSKNEFLVTPNQENGLRAESVVKVDRIVTTKAENIIVHLGKLSGVDRTKLKAIFSTLIE